MYKVYIEEINNISKNKSLENIIKYTNIEMKEVSLKSWSYLSHILKKDYDYKPSTSLEEGLENFVKWYKTFYKN